MKTITVTGDGRKDALAKAVQDLKDAGYRVVLNEQKEGNETAYQLQLQPTYPVVNPPFRWVGGKRKLIPQLLEQLPPQWKNGESPQLLVSPFLGGGAFELALLQRWQGLNQAWLCDSNAHLINCWQEIYEGLHLCISGQGTATTKGECEDSFEQAKYLFNGAGTE
ncbi:MAG: hypothetical protein F6K22_39800 [Okeania sp. SIO2F4]|nr:hypothetical protein [Okeania sp. SIO2F4]